MDTIKLTALERKWILYDVGNSAFTMMISTLFPIFFNALATADGLSNTTYLAYWGYALSASELVVVLTGPFLGAASDKRGRRRPIFAALVCTGALGSALLGFMQQWLVFLAVFCIARVAYQLSLILYDSTLADVTCEERMDTLSSQGYAWGYIGSCIPFIACLVLVLKHEVLGLTQGTAMTIAFALVGVWWFALTVPFLRAYEQKHFVESKAVGGLLGQLAGTLREMTGERKILLFVLAYFFYIDGVYTIIGMSTAYGSALGLDATGLLLALLVTQFVAFPSAILFGRFSRRFRAENLITVCILAYFGIAVFAVFMSAQVHFWILAVCVGMFQGGIQALSRSYFTKIIPPEKSGEFFGFLDICGKGASILGTMSMSVLTQITGNQRIGVAAVALFFLIGLRLFRRAVKAPTAWGSAAQGG